jgi:hypothetical protein
MENEDLTSRFAVVITAIFTVTAVARFNCSSSCLRIIACQYRARDTATGSNMAYSILQEYFTLTLITP